MKTLLTLLIFCSLVANAQKRETVKVIKYFEDGLYMNIRNSKGTAKYVVMGMLEVSSVKTKTKKEFTKFIDTSESNDIFILKKYARIRDYKTMFNNYLLYFYESYNGKTLVKMIKISNITKVKGIGVVSNKYTMHYYLNRGKIYSPLT